MKVEDTGTELRFRVDGTTVAQYVYRPDMPAFEAPKPYLHPIRTLRGDVVTSYRPHDHRWHKGLQMTASEVSGQNFWGGGSYVHGRGYVELANVGAMRHDGFDALGADGVDGVAQRLSWWTEHGQRWVDEIRTLAIRDVDDDSWALEFTTALTNVRGEDLVFGSPTTRGRTLAGYSGLFWRGPRSFTGGEILAEGGRGGEAMMGQRAGWLAYVGQHDEVDRASTLLFIPEGEATWFVRSGPFAAVNPSLAFHETVTLPPGQTWRLSYRIVVADGAWDRDRLQAYAKDHR